MTPAFPRAHVRRSSGKAVGTRGGLVSRVYGDPVEVWMVDGRPARFVWQGRLYTVLRVLEHWVTTRDWWRARHPDADEPAARDFWQVEATSDERAGVYELRHDGATGEWMLCRAWE